MGAITPPVYERSSHPERGMQTPVGGQSIPLATLDAIVQHPYLTRSPMISESPSHPPDPPVTGTSSGTSLGDDALRWAIERVETMRAAVENRAATVVFSGTLLIAGIAALLTGIVFRAPGSFELPEPQKRIVLVMVTLSVVSLIASLTAAIAATVNVWTTSRRLVNNAIPSRVFLHSFDTLFVYNDFPSFAQGWRDLSGDGLRDASLAYLWAAHHLYIKRYLTLQRAARFLLIAATMFMVSVVVLLEAAVIG
jgi:hypothetical protein